MNCSVTGQQKEIETLKETIANLTKQLADKDKEQVRLNSSLSSLRDELEVGQFSLFFICLCSFSNIFRWKRRRTRRSARNTFLCSSNSLKKRRPRRSKTPPPRSPRRSNRSRKTSSPAKPTWRFSTKATRSLWRAMKTTCVKSTRLSRKWRRSTRKCWKTGWVLAWWVDWRRRRARRSTRSTLSSSPRKTSDFARSETSWSHRFVGSRANEAGYRVGSTIQTLESANQELSDELVKVRVEFKVSVGV